MTRRTRKTKEERRYRGTEYKSVLEKDTAKGLFDLRKKVKSKAKISYETENIPYVLRRNYYPDFIIEKEDGTKRYVEVKGYFDTAALVKMKAVIEQNPDLDIVFLFQRDAPVRKRSKMKYSDWCEKMGVDFSIGEIPTRWFE